MKVSATFYEEVKDITSLFSFTREGIQATIEDGEVNPEEVESALLYIDMRLRDAIAKVEKMNESAEDIQRMEVIIKR